MNICGHLHTENSLWSTSDVTGIAKQTTHNLEKQAHKDECELF
jgi:hypothetical protein